MDEIFYQWKWIQVNHTSMSDLNIMQMKFWDSNLGSTLEQAAELYEFCIINEQDIHAGFSLGTYTFCRMLTSAICEHKMSIIWRQATNTKHSTGQCYQFLFLFSIFNNYIFWIFVVSLNCSIVNMNERPKKKEKKKRNILEPKQSKK